MFSAERKVIVPDPEYHSEFTKMPESMHAHFVHPCLHLEPRCVQVTLDAHLSQVVRLVSIDGDLPLVFAPPDLVSFSPDLARGSVLPRIMRMPQLGFL